jgi:hypothetical protein
LRLGVPTISKGFRMSLASHPRTWLKTALTALTLWGAVGSAWAGIPVSGEWDPAIGGPFNLLGWRGTARFDVPAGCLTAGPVSVFSTDPCVVAGGGLNFLGLTVEFYKLADVVAVGGAPTIDTIVFGAAALGVNRIDVLDSQVRKVDTGYTDFAPTTAGSTFNGLDLYGFSVRFDGTMDATLVYGLRAVGGFVGTPGSNEQAGNFAQAPVTYTTPEPGTLALVGAAAALAVLARRRA